MNIVEVICFVTGNFDYSFAITFIYVLMRRNCKINKEKRDLDSATSTKDVALSIDSHLVENERFVKKLEIQIEVIKKIIDPENISLLEGATKKHSCIE